MANEERSKELERARGAPVATTPVEPAKPVTPEPEQTNAGSRTSADDFKADIEAEASNYCNLWATERYFSRQVLVGHNHHILYQARWKAKNKRISRLTYFKFCSLFRSHFSRCHQQFARLLVCLILLHSRLPACLAISRHNSINRLDKDPGNNVRLHIFTRSIPVSTPKNYWYQTKTLTQKVKTLRRKLVFKLACKVMRRRFQEAGMGAGNDPNPPRGPVAVDGFQANAAGNLVIGCTCASLVIYWHFCLSDTRPARSLEPVVPGRM